VKVRSDGANDHLARIETDADLDEHAFLPSDAFGILLHRLLHPQRRIARPHRMVLVGQRRAEERHDAVTHDLVHGPLVAVDGPHHELEDRVEELASFLGITVGEELHRALEVSK
jgi:hypothetical protein